MSTSQSVTLISREAGSAVTVYRLVAQAADGQCDHVADATVRPIGVSAESVATVGQSLPVAIPTGAIVKVEAGATVAALAELEAAGDGTGRVITHTSGVGDYTVGIALTGGAAGDIIEVQLLVDRDQVV